MLQCAALGTEISITPSGFKPVAASFIICSGAGKCSQYVRKNNYVKRPFFRKKTFIKEPADDVQSPRRRYIRSSGSGSIPRTTFPLCLLAIIATSRSHNLHREPGILGHHRRRDPRDLVGNLRMTIITQRIHGPSTRPVPLMSGLFAIWAFDM